MYVAGAPHRLIDCWVGLNLKPLRLVERDWPVALRPNNLRVGLSVVRGQECWSLPEVLGSTAGFLALGSFAKKRTDQRHCVRLGVCTCPQVRFLV